MRLVSGLLLPILLVAGVILLVPASAVGPIGVSARGWALFLCAPVTSLLLLLCGRSGRA